MKIETETHKNKHTKIKSIKKWIIVVSSVFVLLSCNQIVLASDITTQKMIELTNKSRKKSGLLPLKINSKLTMAAEAKVDDMFKFQYFDHNSPSGVTPWYWIKSAGYDYLYAGENLAIDFVTAEGSHLALMRSVTHRDNILKPNYTEIGIAVKEGIFEGNESIIIVEEFGSPLKKVTTVEVKGDIDINLKKKTKIKTVKPESKIAEPKTELVEIKSPIVYFKDENKNEDSENKEIKTEKIINKELVLPIMFPVENIESLDKTFTEDIFWNEYDGEKDNDAFEKVISFLNYKFLLVKLCVLV